MFCFSGTETSASILKFCFGGEPVLVQNGTDYHSLCTGQSQMNRLCYRKGDMRSVCLFLEEIRSELLTLSCTEKERPNCEICWV